MTKVFIKKNSQKRRRLKKIIGSTIIILGLCILIYFFFPVMSYSLFLGEISIETPVPKHAVVKNNNIKDLIAQGVANLSTNFYDARNWYPDIKTTGKASAPVYYLSIPKLEISDAVVSTTDYDLTKHLIQYSGTSIPGENGTAIIFGHSTLPSWFNPKDYKTIFANLHKIENGDEIITNVNGVRYTFKVFSVTVTSPEDQSMFSQSFDSSYLTVITCTPPGTVWKRLIVRATIIKDGQSG